MISQEVLPGERESVCPYWVLSRAVFVRAWMLTVPRRITFFGVCDLRSPSSVGLSGLDIARSRLYHSLTECPLDHLTFMLALWSGLTAKWRASTRERTRYSKSQCVNFWSFGNVSGKLYSFQVLITNGSLDLVDDGLQYAIKTEKNVLDGYVPYNAWDKAFVASHRSRMDQWCTTQHGQVLLAIFYADLVCRHQFINSPVLQRPA